MVVFLLKENIWKLENLLQFLNLKGKTIVTKNTYGK
jgi:hypothetical protein